MQSGQEEQSPVANLVFDTEFIYKAQVEPVVDFITSWALGKDGCAKIG